MTTTLTIPDNYGYVILGCALLPTAAVTYMQIQVQRARAKFDVKYPNLYAVPGVHKDAEAFNRVQRGHQNVLTEGYPYFMVTSLLAGVRYPVAMAVTGGLWSVGALLFQKGYADVELDVKDARYKKGGLLLRFAGAAAFLGLTAMTVEMLGLAKMIKSIKS